MAGSRRLVPTESCPINSPTLNRAHKALTEMARERRFPNFLDEIELFTNEKDIQMNVLSTDRRPARSFFDWCAETIEGFAPGDSIDYPSGGDLFQVPGRCFFQVNRFLTEKLAQVIASDASGGVALDLYAGVGLLTLPLARRFDRVIGVDSSARAVRSLQYNAERAGLTARVVHMDVEAFLPSFQEPADFLVADPPRAGLGRRVTEELIRIKPRRLVLVSCDPATLARDLRPLTDGGYEIRKITLVDLFPQTFHLETIVDLSLR
jgi:23S rRNA (uracil1939-C5)-methyltransferase